MKQPKDKIENQPEEIDAKEPEGAKNEPGEYDVNEACDTLIRAEEIKRNMDLMKLCHKEMGKKIDAHKGKIRSIQDLIDTRNHMAMELQVPKAKGKKQ